MTQLLIDHGLIILFLVVAGESAGVPIPGETALIAAGVLSSQGYYPLADVIAVAAAAAIIGDNAGYWIGRKGGRALLERTPVIKDYFERVLPPAERFFDRHGPKAVFIARFVSVLRVTSAWVAGISRMHWWKFLIWNAAGGIAWAALVAVIAYEFGRTVADAVGRYGLYGAIAVLIVLAVAFIVFRILRRHKNSENAN
ncbi:MAG TPA: DedA family protein [Gaiellaceae bacterium]|nr:DedA family protein [Gaiellaceae bacterium]